MKCKMFIMIVISVKVCDHILKGSSMNLI